MDDMNKDDMSKKEDFNFEWLPGFLDRNRGKRNE